MVETVTGESKLDLYMNRINNSFNRNVIIYALLACLVLTGLACERNEDGGIWPKSDTRSGKKKKPPLQDLVAAPLDGVKVESGLAKRQAIAVMVENLKSIRPQSGLSQASMVVEGLTEGGITRFMVVYQEKEASKIGPVRSARSHFVKLVKGLNALYAHVGGSKFALEDIKIYDIDDLNQFAYSSAFRRAKGISAPHNVFTSTTLLRDAKKEKNIPPPSFSFKSDAPADARPPWQKVTIDFSFPKYKVVWEYDQKTNSYLRFNGGIAHKDAENDEQLKAKNVIIMITPTAKIPTTNLLDIVVTGSGRLQVMRDGVVTEGRWSKASVSAPLRFQDNQGLDIPLNRGQVWLELVPNANKVSITTPTPKG